MSGHAPAFGASCPCTLCQRTRALLAENQDVVETARDRIDGLTAENEQLEAENQQLREFVVAHTLVEKGVTDFDLQNDAVLRLRKASEQPAVLATIREALAGDIHAPP